MSDDTTEFGISGLAITTPIIGRIAIGKRVERNGKVLPSRDDYITITSQVRNGLNWVEHPIQKKLESESDGKPAAEKKLRSIPVRVMYNDPDLNISAEYSAFDQNTGRQLCVGNGIKARRFSLTDNKTNEVDCKSPAYCEYAKQARCKLHARVNVQIEGQDDDMSSFVFRTTGFNSVRTLIYKLKGFHSLCNGMLKGLPLSLVMRAKSTTQSMGQAVYYLDLVLREGVSMVDAVKRAKELHQVQEEAGLNQQAFEMMVKKGLANSAFAETEEDGMDILQDFYFDDDVDDDVPVDFKEAGPRKASGLNALGKVLPSDAEKLESPKQKASIDVSVIDEDDIHYSGVPAAVLSDVTLPPDIAATFDDSPAAVPA
jgi:hypothetical protein